MSPGRTPDPRNSLRAGWAARAMEGSIVSLSTASPRVSSTTEASFIVNTPTIALPRDADGRPPRPGVFSPRGRVGSGGRDSVSAGSTAPVGPLSSPTTAPRDGKPPTNALSIVELLMKQPLPCYYSAAKANSGDAARGDPSILTSATAAGATGDAPSPPVAGRSTPSPLLQTLPPPSIMSLGLCDLAAVRRSFAVHTRECRRLEILARFKRLVARCIKEGEEQEQAEARSAATTELRGSPLFLGDNRSTAATVSNATHLIQTSVYLNGPDLIPTGIPVRHLRKARSQLTWEYEQYVANSMARLQKYRFSQWARKLPPALQGTVLSRSFTASVPDDDQLLQISECMTSAMPPVLPGSVEDGPALQQIRQRPPYLQMDYRVLEGRAEIGAGNCEPPTSPPSYACAWDIDLHDSLGSVVETIKAIGTHLTASGARKRGAAEEDGASGDETAPEPHFPIPSSDADTEEDILIPLPTFIYVISRLLFRLHYAQLFPTGLFNRTLTDPYFFPEVCHADPRYYLQAVPGAYAEAVRRHTDRLHQQHERRSLNVLLCAAPNPIDPADYISVFQLLAPPRLLTPPGTYRDPGEGGPFVPWLLLRPSEENALLKHLSRAEMEQRRIYRSFLQAVGQSPMIRREIKCMMSCCRVVAQELYELVDTEQHGYIKWSEFTDALLEHGEVMRHRMRAEDATHFTENSSSVFDRYTVEPLPKQILTMGYVGRAIEVRHSGSFVLLEGPHDYAYSNFAEMGSIKLKILARPYDRAMADRALHTDSSHRNNRRSNWKKKAGVSLDERRPPVYDAGVERRPWRQHQRIPSVFIRFRDGKRLHEQTALQVIEHLKKRVEASEGDGVFSEEAEELQKPQLVSSDGRERMLDAMVLSDLVKGSLPVLLTHHTDLMFRLYSTANYAQSVPETAMIRTHEAVTCFEWCGAVSGGLSQSTLVHYGVLGTRDGGLIALNFKQMLEAVPRLGATQLGDATSANADGTTYELARHFHMDNTRRFVVCTSAPHSSVVSGIVIRDGGLCLSSSLDGMVCASRLHVQTHDSTKKPVVQLITLRKLHVCDSGVRRIVHAPQLQIFIVQTVANRVFVYSEKNQTARVELFDSTAPHYFPIVAVKAVDSLDQLITADTSGYVKVWSIRRSLPLTSFYALTEDAHTVFGHLLNDEAIENDGGAQSQLHEVDTSSTGSRPKPAMVGGGDVPSCRGANGFLEINRRSIDSNNDSLFPLRSFAYDYVTHRFVATGLHNVVMGSFASGQDEERAHTDGVRFLGLGQQQKRILTVSTADARIWDVNTANMTLGIRANNPEYNLLTAESNHRRGLQSANRIDSDDSSNVARINTAIDEGISLDANKRPPPTLADVIRGVKRAPPGSRPSTQQSQGGGRLGVGTSLPSRPMTASSRAGPGKLIDSTNRDDNARNSNVKQGDVICACWGPQDRSIFYALSTGDIRMHRSDSGRLVKSFITTCVDADDVLTAALEHRHLYGAAAGASEGRADVAMNRAVIRVRMITATTRGADVGSWDSLSAAQKVEAVSVMLQRLLMPPNRENGSGLSNGQPLHREPVSLHYMEAAQELMVVYADGVLRYFPLVGHTLVAHRLFIPEYLVAKCVYYLRAPSPLRRVPRRHDESDGKHFRRSFGPGVTQPLNQPVAPRQHRSGEGTPGGGDAAPLMNRHLPTASISRRPSLVAAVVSQAVPGIAEVDAVSIVAVSTYLQLVCVVHANGTITIMDMGSAGGSNTIHHTFTTPEEVTAACFLGSYPCLVLAERTGHLNFYLVRGAALLVMFDDFFKAVQKDRRPPTGNIQSQSSAPGHADSTTPAAGGSGGATHAQRQSQLEASSPLVWSERITSANRTQPSALHFDKLNATLYVGTADGFVHSFLVRKLIAALDLHPVGVLAEQVNLDAYVAAQKLQQLQSGEAAIRNNLLVMFGLSPERVTAHICEEEAGWRKGARSPPVLAVGSGNTIQRTPEEPLSFPSDRAGSSSGLRWKNSLLWVYEHCKKLFHANGGRPTPCEWHSVPATHATLRGTSISFEGDSKGGDLDEEGSGTFAGRSEPADYLLPLDRVTLSDLLLAAAVINDAVRIIAFQEDYKLGASCGPDESRDLDVAHPTMAFLRLSGGPEVTDEESNNRQTAFGGGRPRAGLGEGGASSLHQASSEGNATFLRRSDVIRIRQWMVVALASSRSTGDRYAAPARLLQHGAMHGSVEGGPQHCTSFHSFVRSARAELLGSTLVLSEMLALHGSLFSDRTVEEVLPWMSLNAAKPITWRWVEHLFERHSVFMSANSPLALLSPGATVERARRERYELLKRIQHYERYSSSPADSSAGCERPTARWDEYIEGTVPRLVLEVFKQPGRVLRDASRLRRRVYTVTQITTRRNGYVLIGNGDGTVSLWTPYVGARLAHLCPSTTLATSLTQLGRSVKRQFRSAFDMHAAEQQRMAFETDNTLGRNAAEGEQKIKSHIKSILVQHHIDELKRGERRQEEEAEEAFRHGHAGAVPSPRQATTTPHKNRRQEPMLSQVSVDGDVPLRRLLDHREVLQLSLGITNTEAFRARRLLVEDLCFLPLRLLDLAQMDAFDPTAFPAAVDLAVGRLLQDVCGDKLADEAMLAMQRDSLSNAPSNTVRRIIAEGGNMTMEEVIRRGTFRLTHSALNRVLGKSSIFDFDFVCYAHELCLAELRNEEKQEISEMVYAVKELQETQETPQKPSRFLTEQPASESTMDNGLPQSVPRTNTDTASLSDNTTSTPPHRTSGSPGSHRHLSNAFSPTDEVWQDADVPPYLSCHFVQPLDVVDGVAGEDRSNHPCGYRRSPLGEGLGRDGAPPPPPSDLSMGPHAEAPGGGPPATLPVSPLQLPLQPLLTLPLVQGSPDAEPPISHQAYEETPLLDENRPTSLASTMQSSAPNKIMPPLCPPPLIFLTETVSHIPSGTPANAALPVRTPHTPHVLVTTIRASSPSLSASSSGASSSREKVVRTTATAVPLTHEETTIPWWRLGKHLPVKARLGRTGRYQGEASRPISRDGTTMAAGTNGTAASLPAQCPVIITRTKRSNNIRPKALPPASVPSTMAATLKRGLPNGDTDGKMSLASRKKTWSDLLPNP